MVGRGVESVAMQRIEPQIVTFEKGMTEGIKQDMFFEGQNAYQSVLWLENYNPNLEYGSLIKRPGETSKYEDYNWGTDPLNVTRQSELISCNLSNFNNRIHASNLEYMIRRMMAVPVAHPRSHDNIVLFIDRKTSALFPNFYPGNDLLDNVNDYEATAVVAYVEEFTTGNTRTITRLKPRFTEPFSYHPEEAAGWVHPHPGWYTFGTFQDSSRYGESIVFCTRLITGNYEDENKIGNNLGNSNSDITKFMYPCYVWKRWDLTRKREEKTTDYFNGLTFTPDLGDKNEWSRYEVQLPSMKLFREKQIGAIALREDNPSNIGFLDPAYPITPNKWNSRSLPEYFYRDMDNNQLTVLPNISLVFWEDQLAFNEYLPYNRGISYNLANLCTTIDTWERIDLPQLYDQQSTFPIGTNIVLRQLTSSTSKDIYEVVEWNDTNSGFHYVLVHSIPDYKAMSFPRCWLKGETIPYAITGLINGVEVYLTHGEYSINGASLNVPTPASVSAQEALNGADWRLMAKSMKLKAWQTYQEYDIVPAYKDTGVDIEVNNYTQVYFTLRIDAAFFNEMSNLNIESIKIYVSKPSDESILKNIGRTGSFPPPPLSYHKPLQASTTNDIPSDFSNYALVKEFCMQKPGKKIQSYDDYRGEETATNAWLRYADVYGDAVWAVPQDDGDEFPNIVSTFDGRVPIQPWLGPFTGSGNFNNFPRINQHDLSSASPGWTPDFIIWDYPTGSPLLLGSSGKYWKGLGARLICVIKGRTFLAGTIDSKGMEEPAIVRYSTVQSGAISPDVFVDEDQIQVGHLPQTSIFEFREQLVVFNREGFYRLVMPSITDVSSWEFLEGSHGQGTFSQKTVTTTPHGFCFVNENGVWISDGGKPESLSNMQEAGIVIESIIKKLAINTAYPYLLIHDPGQVPQRFFTSDNEQFVPHNTALELNYDDAEDELIITSPVWKENLLCGQRILHTFLLSSAYFPENGNQEIRLIFNFKARNWRVESYIMPDLNNSLDPNNTYIEPNFDGLQIPVNSSTFLTWGRTHKLHTMLHGLLTTRFVHNVRNGLGDYYVEFGTKDTSLYYDKYLKNAALFQNDSNNIFSPIYANLITHEIGNGRDDYLFHSLISECEPREWQNTTLVQDLGWDNALYPAKLDPVLLYELRNKTWSAQKHRFAQSQVLNNLVDIVALNMNAKGGNNPYVSLMQTPRATTPADDLYLTSGGVASQQVARESMTMLMPLNTKFRHARFYWCSEMTMRIRHLLIKAAVHGRRNQ